MQSCIVLIVLCTAIILSQYAGEDKAAQCFSKRGNFNMSELQLPEFSSQHPHMILHFSHLEADSFEKAAAVET